MPYLIGTDEAGYGPNLGPLVVAASLWEVPHKTPADALYDLLNEVICPGIPAGGDRRLPMADSKVLYKAGGGLGQLERSVLCALTLAGLPSRNWRELWNSAVHGGECCQNFETLPWHAGFDLDLPAESLREEISAALQLLEVGLAAANVRLAAMQSAVLFPREYNSLVAKTDNKSEVLSLTTLRLVERILALIPSGHVQVTCDKHGGRDRYAALLQHVFPDSLLSVRCEGREESVYRLVQGDRQVDFHFLVRGERFLPTALASMFAKYLRELAMKPFNAFWQRQIPGLKATAGYYEDAHRFCGEIAVMQKQLGIADEILRRCR